MRISGLIGVGLSCFLSVMAQELSTEMSAITLSDSAEVPAGQGQTAPAVAEEASAEKKLLMEKLSFLATTALQYVDEGEYEDAERAYVRALEAAPEDANIRFRLSTLYVLMGRFAEAVPLLEALVEEYPDNSQIHNNLAWSYATGAGVKDRVKALRHAREALLLTPNVPSIWNTLAEAYYVAGEYDKAARASDQALELLQKTNPDASSIETFKAQSLKIKRAQQAAELLTGTRGNE